MNTGLLLKYQAIEIKGQYVLRQDMGSPPVLCITSTLFSPHHKVYIRFDKRFLDGDQSIISSGNWEHSI